MSLRDVRARLTGWCAAVALAASLAAAAQAGAGDARTQVPLTKTAPTGQVFSWAPCTT